MDHGSSLNKMIGVEEGDVGTRETKRKVAPNDETNAINLTKACMYIASHGPQWVEPSLSSGEESSDTEAWAGGAGQSF